jgi:hypothetical protein
MYLLTLNATSQMNQFPEAFADRVTEDTFRKIEIFFRDADLDPATVRQYKPGLILLENGYMDASLKEGGPSQVVRYQIYTNQRHTFQENFVEYGSWTFPRKCYYKVLDVSQFERNTLITLLHVPEYAIHYFAVHDHPKEQAIILESKRRFETMRTQPPRPEFDAFWFRRTAFPIGIDHHGRYFYEDQLAPAEQPVAARPIIDFFKRLLRRRQ